MIGDVQEFEAIEKLKQRAMRDAKELQKKLLKGRISLVQINKEM